MSIVPASCKTSDIQSSYFYQHKIQQSPYKYEAIKVKIIKLFRKQGKDTVIEGHSLLERYISLYLKKIVRPNVKDNNLVVKKSENTEV